MIAIFLVMTVTSNAAKAAKILGFPKNWIASASLNRISGKINAAKTEVGTYLRMFSNHSGTSEFLTWNIALNRIKNVAKPDMIIAAQIIELPLS